MFIFFSRQNKNVEYVMNKEIKNHFIQDILMKLVFFLISKGLTFFLFKCMIGLYTISIQGESLSLYSYKAIIGMCKGS